MKRIASIGLILLMSLQCFYKLGVITYFQLNHDYIARVLCINKAEPAKHCDGQCFLKNKLALANETSPDRSTPPPEQRLDFPVFLISAYSYSFKSPQPLAHDNSRYLAGISPGYHATPFRPPTSAPQKSA